MADNEHRVLKSNTFEDQRQKVNEISFDVGDDALLDNTSLSDKVFTYTVSDIDFDASYDELDENGEPTGNKIPVYNKEVLNKERHLG